jgi:type 1 glutamine amidotransferase
VIWKHTYGKGRVFGTTLTHHNHHMSDPAYLDMVTRGLLWACDQLDDNGHAKPGYRVGTAAGGT